MKETVTDPLLFFLVSILFGVCLHAIYDIISSDGIYISLYI